MNDKRALRESQRQMLLDGIIVETRRYQANALNAGYAAMISSH